MRADPALVRALHFDKQENVPLIDSLVARGNKDTFNATDLGNAERFAAQHGDLVRYVSAWKSWLVWDGKRWARDLDGQVFRLASSTVRSIYAEALNGDTKDQREALAAHAVHSESERRIVAMIDLAKSRKPIATVPETFDAISTNYLLNVENGTIDLRAGTLQEHRCEDYITKLAPVNFDPEALSDRWDSFLERQVPDTDLRAFLPRAAGYTLTGDTGEEKLILVHGPEAAGKSTFTESIKSTLGDYAATTDFETFLRKRGDAGVRNDIARLAGARMVLSLEVDEGRHLAEALVKNLTGGDTIAARHLYQSFFEFRPAFKLWLVANHTPRASAEDGALWRRILLVPFTVTVPVGKRDPQMKQALKEPAARAAILAWAVRGCLDWQRGGLAPPKLVKDATAAYREACDHVGTFLEDTFTGISTEITITAADMRASYNAWCERNGEKPLSAQGVAKALKRRGFDQTREAGTGTRGWKRPALPEQERDA